MHLPITIALLTSITSAILFLRFFWVRVPYKVSFFLVRLAVVLVFASAFSSATKWELNSDHGNAVLKWLAVSSYEFLLMYFSLISPRWFTSLCAVILVIPVFSASILMPLSDAFNPNTYGLSPIDKKLSYQKMPWGENATSNTGIDLRIFYRPEIAPFLRHMLQSVPFNNGQCNTSAIVVTPGPAAGTVLAHCPPWPSQSTGTVERLIALHSTIHHKQR